MQIYAPLIKADTARHEITGVIAVEMPDSAGEIMDYAASKPLFIAWSERVKKITGGKSLGNVRDSHTSKAVGKIVKMTFDDTNKAVRVVAKIVDAEAWQKVVEGIFGGFSIGGAYGWKQQVQGLTRYQALPMEVSLVDIPAIPGAVFDAVKAAQIKELKKMDNTKLIEALQSAGLTEEQVAALADKLGAMMADGMAEMQKDAPPADADAASESTEPEAAPALTAEDVKSIVSDLLVEYGLIASTGGNEMAMGQRIDGLAKSIAASAPAAALQKAQAQIDGVEKSVAKLAEQMVELAKRAASGGPVLRAVPLDAAQETGIESLRKSLTVITDPATAQAVRNEIARLEIRAAQITKGQK